MRTAIVAAALALAAALVAHAAPTTMPVVFVADGVLGLTSEFAPEIAQELGVTPSEFNAGLRTGDADALHQRLAAGEAFDLALLSSWTMANLIASGAADARSQAPIARTAIGLAVPAGRPRPDVSTVARFRETMLGARSVLVTAATAPGSTRLPLEQALQRLGIAEAMQGKMLYAPAGQSAQWLAQGRADYAVNFVSNIVRTKGVDLVGPLPSELQRYNGFDAIISTRAVHRESSERIVRVLQGASPERLARLGLLPPS